MSISHIHSCWHLKVDSMLCGNSFFSTFHISPLSLVKSQACILFILSHGCLSSFAQLLHPHYSEIWNRYRLKWPNTYRCVQFCCRSTYFSPGTMKHAPSWIEPPRWRKASQVYIGIFVRMEFCSIILVWPKWLTLSKLMAKTEPKEDLPPHFPTL